MKVLYIVTAFPRHAEDVITPWLQETIFRLGVRGIEVEVLAPAYRGLRDQTVHGIRVHRFRYAPRPWETLTHDQTAPDRIRERPIYLTLLPGYLLAGSLAAIRLARSGEFDLLHAFWPLPHGLLGLAAKRATGVPLISTFFGVELTWVDAQLRPLKPLLRRVVRGSDAVTAISTHTANLLRRLDPAAEPVTIPFGAAVETESVSPPQDRAEGPFRLLFVGRLVQRKGVHILLSALAQEVARSAIQLDVIGDGPDREALIRQANVLGLASAVTFHGFVPREVLETSLATCDALVLPAVVDAKGDVEGLGVVLLEAMGFGKPVIASAAGGITDIVDDGRNGRLVPPGDAAALAHAIRELAGDRLQARKLGQQGRDDVTARFSWAVIVDRLVALYERTAARETIGG